MSDAVTASENTLSIKAMMLEFGSGPENTQFDSRNPSMVLGVSMTSSLPAELPLKTQDVREGAKR
jgi:hypothetical protein